ncbi:hypothetical protein [Actinophytocola sp.]|uniref:hypothetical protein n=1 Tax=Actinophytocola sp. TaxID=1872138 RepID=UPI003D6B9F1A
MTGRYVSLGRNAETVAYEYIRHYYGDEGSAVARADTLTNADEIHAELDRLAEAGVTDLVLYPCSAEWTQLELLADALEDVHHRRPVLAVTRALY